MSDIETPGKVTVRPTTATYVCPRRYCGMEVECRVDVHFTVEKIDSISSKLVGHAKIDPQPMWDHLLMWHGPAEE